MNDPLYEYIERNSTRQTEALDWVERQTHLRSIYSHMLCGPVEGRLLNLLTSMIRPERALELGVFTGYSSICIASALPAGAHLDALEINDELEDVIRGGYARAGVEDRINLILGNANESLSQLSGPYDLVFIDANKREYVKYYNAVIDKVRPGGFILADNVLWSGKVLEMEHVSGSGAHHTDAQTKGIMEFNELVANDPRVENVIIPLRDGLNIIRKKLFCAPFQCRRTSAQQVPLWMRTCTRGGAFPENVSQGQGRKSPPRNPEYGFLSPCWMNL